MRSSSASHCPGLDAQHLDEPVGALVDGPRLDRSGPETGRVGALKRRAYGRGLGHLGRGGERREVDECSHPGSFRPIERSECDRRCDVGREDRRVMAGRFQRRELLVGGGGRGEEPPARRMDEVEFFRFEVGVGAGGAERRHRGHDQPRRPALRHRRAPERLVLEAVLGRERRSVTVHDHIGISHQRRQVDRGRTLVGVDPPMHVEGPAPDRVAVMLESDDVGAEVGEELAHPCRPEPAGHLDQADSFQAPAIDAHHGESPSASWRSVIRCRSARTRGVEPPAAAARL